MLVAKIITAALLFFWLAPIVTPQVEELEYGSTCELKGIQKIFIDVKIDGTSRESIIAELQKGLPDLKIVSHPEEADVQMRFFMEERKDASGNIRQIPAGLVVKAVGPQRIRQVFCFKDIRIRYAADRTPSMMYARYFVDEVKRARSGDCVR